MPNGQVQHDQFARHCEIFLKKVREVLQQQLGVPPRSYRHPVELEDQPVASRMLGHVFLHLEDPKEIAHVSAAASETLSQEGKVALGWELQFVAESDPLKLEDAKTAKDSIEELIGPRLREKIKDLLKVLNEILKIVSGRGEQ